jgi:AraC-like DNA-binding protein
MLLKLPQDFNGQQTLKIGNTHFALLKQRVKTQKRMLLLHENTLVFVVEGHKLLHFEDTSIQISAGSVLLMKRGFYVMSDIIESGLNFKSLLIYFSNEQVKKFLLKFNYTQPASPLSESYLTIPATSALDDFREHYVKYFNQNISTLPAVLNLKLYELFLLLLSTPQQQQVLAFLQQTAFQQTDISYLIKQYLFQPITLPELAKLSGRSLATFKRDFVQLYQKAPGKWITEQRLNYARVILQQTPKQVAEIAYECGYNNVPHFIKAYKQHFGVTPNQNRANLTMI